MAGPLAILFANVLQDVPGSTARQVDLAAAELRELPPEKARALGPKVVRAAELLGADGLPLLRAIFACPSLHAPTYVRAMTALRVHAPQEALEVALAYAGHLPPALLVEHAAAHLDEIVEEFGARWERSADARAALQSPELVRDPAFVDRALRVMHDDPVHACRVLAWNASPRALEELVQVVERARDLRDPLCIAALTGLSQCPLWSPTDLGPQRRFLRTTPLAPVLVRLLKGLTLPNTAAHADWERPLVFVVLGLRQEIRALAPDDPHIEAALERYRFPMTGERMVAFEPQDE